MHGIVLLAHGARDPGWAQPFEAVRDRIRAQRPEWPIELAYLEVMAPTLEEAIASLAARGALAITVFPLFMAQRGSLRLDIPRILEAIRATHPHVPIALESAMGEVPEIRDAIAGWIVRRID